VKPHLDPSLLLALGVSVLGGTQWRKQQRVVSSCC